MTSPIYFFLLPIGLICLGLYSLIAWLAIFGQDRPPSPDEIEDHKEHDAQMAEWLAARDARNARRAQA